MKPTERQTENKKAKENTAPARKSTSLDEALGEANPVQKTEKQGPRQKAPGKKKIPPKKERVTVEREADGRERIIENEEEPPRPGYVDLPMEREIENAGDLFGPEEAENAKEAAQEQEAEDFDPAKQPVQVIKKKRRRRYGLPVGILVVLLAVVGLGFLGTQLYQYIYKVATDDSVERAYDTYLEPVVMLDPQPFETLEGADKKMLLQASVWLTVFENIGRADLEYDDAARVILPADLVNESAVKLFGPDCVLSPTDISVTNMLGAEEGSPQATIQYVAEENAYHVPLPTNVGSYRPYTEKVRRRGNLKYLRVAYRTSFDYSETGEVYSRPEGQEDSNYTVKYMEYELTYDPETETEYISAIRAVE